MWLSLIAATSGYLTAYLIIYVLKKVWTAKRTPETKDQDGSRSKGSSSSQLRMYVEHGSNDVNTHKALEDSIPEFESTSRWVFREDDTIVTCDLDLIKTMVVDKTSQAHASHHVFKSSLDSDVRSQNSIMANGNRWGEIRQIVAPILSSPSIQAEINQVINKFTAAIESKFEKARQDNKRFIELDLDDIFHRYVLDLVFTCFYQQVNKVDYDADKDLWREIVGHILSDEQRGHEAYCSIFSIPNPLVRLFVEECHHQGAVERRLLDFVKLQMKLSFELKRGRHRANRSSQTIVCKRNSSTLSNGGVLIARNVIDHAIDQFHEDKLTLTEYTYTLFFLFLAANKTSGSALSSLIYFIAIRQDVQGKLRESIIADGVDSEYLELVINEAMRFLLPSRLGFPQTIASGSDSIQGTIPAYTLVLRSTFSFLRPTNLEKHQCDSVNGFKQLFKQRLYSNSYSTPHMTSAKNCSGKKFAMQGMKMLMNVLMRRYTFDFAPVDKNSMSSHASMIISQDSIQIRMYRITTEL